MVDSDRTRDLLKVQELYFQRQSAAFKVILLNATHQFQHSMVEVNGDVSILVDILGKGLFATYRLALPL